MRGRDMEREKAFELVEENTKTIFAYALSRVSHKEDAEDLAGDIVLAILLNASRIRDDNAFFGYIWSIAANTYKKFLRKKSRASYEELDEETAADDDFTTEILKTEEYGILRRELALLSREYRECTLAYYFDRLSCKETAARLHISLEMVKYYLFKTRKILKEGINMEREFGEKSYRPAKFEFYAIFAGKANMEYQNLFNRKLPGNILLSAYYTPMTIRELAIELGVANAYLEDEIALLEKYHLLTALPGGKYQARLVIFTEDYWNEFYRTVEKAFTKDVGAALSSAREKLPEIRALGFPGSDTADDRLLWALLYEMIRNAWHSFTASLGNDCKESEIYRGATGTCYGLNYESPEDDTYIANTFAGYWPINAHYAASYADFGILPPKNRWTAHSGKVAEMLENTLAGNASPAIPVVSGQQKGAIEEILRKEAAAFAKIYESLYDCALSIMKVHAPESVAQIADRVVANSLLFHTVGLIGACAVRSGALTIPEDELPLGGFIYET